VSNAQSEASSDASVSTDRPPAPGRPPGRIVYSGLFLLTLATLLLELGLTRIFSVVIYHHMAFFAISVTMFGLAFGATIVHFRPDLFTPASAPRWMQRSTLAFALAVALSLVLLLAIPFDVTRNRVLIPQLLAVAVALAVAFACGGVAVALALTRFPRRANLLYGWDLAGAAAGCLLFAPMITRLGGPRFILAVATVLALAAVVLAIEKGGARRLLAAVVATLLLAAVTWRADSMPIFKIRHMRGAVVDPAMWEWEGWNSISRITVGGEGLSGAEGVAPRFYDEARTTQVTLLIDSLAATPILKFDGERFDKFFYPFHDVSYAVHALRPDASVAIIGVGGGRDVVAAKAWGQPEVVGIEINDRVIEALTVAYADYDGHPLQWPGFRLVHDEARSYLTRAGRSFDVIQASLIDTFAATAAGAFVLTENGLYTLEGWDVFLDHLTPRGVLTMSRWYTEGNPVESVRLLALARAALEARGVRNPRDHILMLRTPQPLNDVAQPLATILVSNAPFSEEDIAKFEQWTRDNDLIELVTPRTLADPLLAEVLTASELNAFLRDYPFEVSPPTDDRPFFFDVLRWRDILVKEYRQGSQYIFSINLKPLVMLGTLLLTVIALAAALVVVPLALQNRRRDDWRRLPAARRAGMVIYFIMLGLGYLLVELTLVQRLTLFLGHPSYSLTVCLFTMLLASGLGSMVAPRWAGSPDWNTSVVRLRRLNLALFFVLALTLVAVEVCVRGMIALPTPARILTAGALILPAGFLMGMPFPLGLQAAARRAESPLAWFWGLNGAFSVCASVLTVALAHSLGLRAAFLAGAVCYLAAAQAAKGFTPDK
jgi:hypothetical protein